MSAEPGNRFADPDTKRFARLKIWNELFDLRIVEYARMGFVAFQIASQFGSELTYKISRNFYDVRRLRADSISYLGVDLIPGQNLISGDMKGFTNRLLIPSETRKADGKIAAR